MVPPTAHEQHEWLKEESMHVVVGARGAPAAALVGSTPAVPRPAAPHFPPRGLTAPCPEPAQAPGPAEPTQSSALEEFAAKRQRTKPPAMPDAAVAGTAAALNADAGFGLPGATAEPELGEAALQLYLETREAWSAEQVYRRAGVGAGVGTAAEAKAGALCPVVAC